MGLLEGRKAVVMGASGIVGSGIARRFLEEGATVVAPMRTETSLPGLTEELEGLVLREGQLDAPFIDYGTEQGAAALAQHVRDVHGGSVDIVVSCLAAGFKTGTLSTLTADDVHAALDRAVPHMHLAQALMPLLKEDPASCYIFVDGMLGEVCSLPNWAAVSIANGAIYGIIRALEAECKDKPQRINELRIAALIRKTGQPCHPRFPRSVAYPASLVGDEAVALAAGQQRGQIVRVKESDLFRG